MFATLDFLLSASQKADDDNSQHHISKHANLHDGDSDDDNDDDDDDEGALRHPVTILKTPRTTSSNGGVNQMKPTSSKMTNISNLEIQKEVERKARHAIRSVAKGNKTRVEFQEGDADMLVQALAAEWGEWLDEEREK